jgi:hypothetical protein
MVESCVVELESGAVEEVESAAESCGCCTGFSTAELGAVDVVAVDGLETAAGCVWLWTLSLIGEVGESRSREPEESLVRFFFKNPRVGIEAF